MKTEKSAHTLKKKKDGMPNTKEELLTICSPQHQECYQWQGRRGAVVAPRSPMHLPAGGGGRAPLAPPRAGAPKTMDSSEPGSPTATHDLWWTESLICEAQQEHPGELGMLIWFCCVRLVSGILMQWSSLRVLFWEWGCCIRGRCLL